MIPMIMLAFVVAGLMVCGSVAASAAFLAQRDLAGLCDGAAVAAANAADLERRTALDGPLPALSSAVPPAALPLTDASVAAALTAYRADDLGAPVDLAADTDGQTVTVTCRRRVRIPFGAVLGHRDGLDRTVVARARSPLS